MNSSVYCCQRLFNAFTSCWKPKPNCQLETVIVEKVFVLSFASVFRAYPGSEFVVANTSQMKKLEPNEIDFSQKVVSRSCSVFNTLPARGDFCHLLITLANSLDPDQARRNVRPDLDPNCLTP